MRQTVVVDPMAGSMSRLDDKTDAEVVALYGQVMSELHRRGVVRSGNNPIGDMAETIIADYYGVIPQPPNNKSFDVLAPDGTKIEVKALRRTKPSRKGLSPLRTLDFDFVAVVIFADDMQLEEAVLVPLKVVREYMGWSKTWKSNRLSVTQKLLNDARIMRLSPTELVAGARRGRRKDQ
jgi:hypothetical protein